MMANGYTVKELEALARGGGSFPPLPPVSPTDQDKVGGK